MNLSPCALELIRVFIWLLLLMVIFIPVERLWSLRPQKVFRKGFAADLLYYILNSLAPKALLALPMTLVAWAMRHAAPEQVPLWVGSLRLRDRLLLSLVVGEIGFYWGHRWAHQIPFLWRFHAVHHSAEDIDWLVSTRAHPLDLVFVRLCGLVPLYALGLAQPIAGQTLDPVPMLILLAGSAWGFFVHANVRCRFGLLGNVIATPAFHHWHHTNDEHRDRNYASMLPWIDRLFGTWYMPKNQWPVKYGIDGSSPAGVAEQLLEPFMPAGRDTAPTADSASAL